jgi:predicted AlkP superfamily pyrophosphatase or phosphodiesterase
MKEIILTLFITILVKTTRNDATSPATTGYPLLVISLDGFRADKLDSFIARNATSTLATFAKNGVKADYMIPQFPSSTFANHQTLVTGLHAESHGIIGNSVYDPDTNLKADFVLGTNAYELQFWNQSDPIWITARKQNHSTSASLWPGSDVWPRTPGF